MSREKYGFVYIWRDRKHNRFYVGSHWGTEDDGYICSSPWMKQAHLHRPQDFKRRILARVYTTRKDLLNEELRYLLMIKPEEVRVRYYNIHIKANGHWIARDDGLSVAQRSGKTRTGIPKGPCSPEKAKRISEAKLTKKHKMTEETKAKMSEAAKLRKASEETKAKMAHSQRTRHQTHEHYSQKPGWSPKPKKVHPTLHCQICQEPTNSHKRKFCDLHRYEGMNLTRAAKEGSKWHS